MIQNFHNEYIHGDKFLMAAEYSISDAASEIPDELLGENCCVLCQTHHVRRFFDKVRHSKSAYVLVTHNSDVNVGPDLWRDKPGCVARWYAQNALVEADGLIPIPIGLERPYKGTSWDSSAVLAAGRDRGFENLAYMAHQDGTNPAERSPISAKLGSKPWVTHEQGRAPFDVYLRRMAAHKFTISPPGNGADCHRTWECLYVGGIPVVKRTPFNAAFAEILSIMVVDDVSEVTEDALWDKYYKVATSHRDPSPLTMKYWLGLIERDKKAIGV